MRLNMECKYLAVRTKQYTRYLYCRLLKQQTTYIQCKSCLKLEYKPMKPIKKKTTALNNLEKKRYSILTNDFEHCYICGRVKKQIHEIYKGRNRQKSMKNGFCIPICEECHSKTETDVSFLNIYRQECQKKYEETHTREEFMQIIGKNYLDN